MAFPWRAGNAAPRTPPRAPPPPRDPRGQAAPAAAVARRHQAPAPRQAAPAPRRPAVDPERVLERIHANLYRQVAVAVEPIADLETKWSQSELTKRIVGYIYRAAKQPELFEASWREVSAKVVTSSMQGYISACQDSQWFFEIEITECLGSTVWEIIGGAAQREVSFNEVVEHLGTLYEAALDMVLLGKAFTKACEETWPDDTKLRAKMSRFLYATYEPAQNEVLAESRAVEPLAKMEKFMKLWMEQSMQRAWSACQHNDKVLTEQVVSQLFSALVSPFGVDHNFSCIPFVLTKDIGKPDEEWSNTFIEETTTKLFEKWRQEDAEPSQAEIKRQKKTAGGADVEMKREDRSRSPPPQRRATGRAVKQEPAPAAEDNVHPDCTSAEDCIGNREDRLIRHLLDGELRDPYCEACWVSFKEQNQTLEGIWEDTDEPFE